MEIDSFSGDYAFLSNFYPCAVRFESDVYPSAEHAYVAAKTQDLEMRRAIKAVPTAGKVKRLGRNLVLRPGWNQMRLAVMRLILASKFKHQPLADLLLATGDATLIEGNHRGDRFWGVCNGTGRNNLGLLLMERRDLLRIRPLF
jgi:ribA/ribD-fused uncharacterized protein